MKVGILFNFHDNNFHPYLEWIQNYTSENKNKKCVISKIHTNDFKEFSSRYSELCHLLTNDVNDVLKNSDIVFSLGYWKILKKHQINQVNKGVVNFHHSFNLKYKGRHSATWAIRNNEKLHGSTMHFIDEKVDEGSIIDSKSFEIKPDDTAENVFKKANLLGLEILSKNFESLISCKETIDLIDSRDLNQTSYTYRKRDLSHEIGILKLKNDQEIYRELRALAYDNKPAPYIMVQGRKVYLKLEEYDDGILRRKNESIK